ncbi:hypothetical protein NEOCIP111885_03285 [Pseudoneobacillus rhizosphaerae]|uniref:Uncharacterized protein n=1 Tax=Pseudoneobacillus rhizosphaerae TaxID=2880968 RepID=A0A9C7LC51_9BACI|nr:hypothetical protein NEOCIP111885_03285 [Pseudoneobacillus rhizosphaerae]
MVLGFFMWNGSLLKKECPLKCRTYLIYLLQVNGQENWFIVTIFQTFLSKTVIKGTFSYRLSDIFAKTVIKGTFSYRLSDIFAKTVIKGTKEPIVTVFQTLSRIFPLTTFFNYNFSLKPHSIIFTKQF